MKKDRMWDKKNERGGARLKFIMALVIFAVVVYVGYLYVPIALDAYYFKDSMQNKVDMAAAQGYEPQWVSEQLVKSEPEYHVPPDAIITPGRVDNRIVVRVQFSRPISFPGFTYKYEFDQTAKSTTFLMPK